VKISVISVADEARATAARMALEPASTATMPMALGKDIPQPSETAHHMPRGTARITFPLRLEDEKSVKISEGLD